MNFVRQLKNTTIFTNEKLVNFYILFRLTAAKFFIIMLVIITVIIFLRVM